MNNINVDNFVRTETPFKTEKMSETDGKMWSLYTQGMAEYEKHDKDHKYYVMDKLTVTEYSPSGILEDKAFRIENSYSQYKQIVILPKEATSQASNIYGQLSPIILYPETFSDILKTNSSVYFEGKNGLIIKDTLPYTYTQYFRVNTEKGKLIVKPQNVLMYDVDLNSWSFKTYAESKQAYTMLAYGIKEKVIE